MLIPRGIVPQLQIGINMPETVAQKIPLILPDPIAVFCIFSGFRNSRSRPARIKLQIIQTEALSIIFQVEKKIFDKNPEKLFNTLSMPPQKPL